MKYIAILTLSVLMCSPICAMQAQAQAQKESDVDLVAVVKAPFQLAWWGAKLAGRGVYGAGSYLFGGDDSDDGKDKVVDVGGGRLGVRLGGGSGGRGGRGPGGRGPWGDSNGRDDDRYFTLRAKRQRQAAQAAKKEEIESFAGFIASLFSDDE